MRTIRLIALWFAIVASFGLFGWFSCHDYTNDGPFYTDLRFEPAVGSAAAGTGVACCIVIGILVLRAVRSQRLRKGWATLLLIVSAIATIILPWFIVSAIMRATQYQGHGDDYFAAPHLFQGEHGWWLLIAPYFTFWIVLFTLIVFLVCVFTVARPNTY